MLDLPADGLDHIIRAFCALPWPDQTFLTFEHNVRGLLATLIVCFVCGAMGSLVVGNRMAFFSDALAHCAFAGVGLGLLLAIVTGVSDDSVRQLITLIMVCFGVGIGLMIAFVRENTELASDTVIGVFFAGAIGLGAVIMGATRSRQIINIESFIFGDPHSVGSWEVVLLLGLAGLVAVFLGYMYNWLVLASASPSLALSRQVPVRWCRYLFVVLLALMVNLSQQITGMLLINGLLIVPAAAAANLASNLREMFWYSIIISMLVGLIGYWLSWEISSTFYQTFTVGVSGTIIVLSALVFVGSMALTRAVRRS
ncbi:MAG: metal ABC transporter permease [Planctomycetes bacterium]|nr:metal ABC transporter permease [Planctomycetota bacterium]